MRASSLDLRVNVATAPGLAPLRSGGAPLFTAPAHYHLLPNLRAAPLSTQNPISRKVVTIVIPLNEPIS
jgi:hypothetical protein